MNKIEIGLLEIFYFLSIALAFFFGVEILFPGMVLAYLNLNYVLILWVINGMIILFKPQKNDR